MALGELQDEVPDMPDETLAGLEEPLLEARQGPTLNGERQNKSAQEIAEIVRNHAQEQPHLLPDLGIGRVAVDPGGTPKVEVLLRHHRLRVFGADAATTLGRFGLRGEVAYALTQDLHGRNPEVKNPYVFLVFGIDRTLREHLNLNVQYLFRAVINFRDPESIQDPLQRPVAIEQGIIANQLDRFQHGASIRVSNKWLNETLEAEVVALYWFTRGDYAIRPKAIYAFTDRIKGTLGADVFRGPPKSFFGRIRDTSTVFAEVKFSF